MSARLRALCIAATLLAAACGGKDESDEAAAPEAAGAESADGAASPAPDDGSVDVIDTTFFFDEEEALPTADALKKYEAECAGQATPECKQLQWQLEFALYEDVRELARSGALDDALVRIGAAADSPQLKSFCLERILARGLQPEEHALVIAAFDDPYPLVRGVAQQLARQLPDEKWSRMLARDAGVPRDGVAGLIAAPAPDEKSLGAPLYPRARHWNFASSAEHGELFTTDDSPGDVVAFYAKGGREVLSGEQLKEKIQSATNFAQNPMLVAQKMQEAVQAGENPEAVMKALSASAAAASVDWTKDIEGEEGVRDVRYVVLAQEESIGQPLPSRVLAVFTDEAMGATGLIFRNKPRVPAAPDLATPEDMERYLRVQQILSSPDAQAR